MKRLMHTSNVVNNAVETQCGMLSQSGGVLAVRIEFVAHAVHARAVKA